jgi:hypothetical protein
MMALTNSSDLSPWTHLVMQMAENTPSVRHAAIAVSELYQCYGERNQPNAAAEHKALGHYNLAIHHVIGNDGTDRNTVLVVCILFICLEFLRGDAAHAITHVEHGHRIVGTGCDRRLLLVFRRLSVFPFFFSRTFPKHVTFLDDCSPDSTLMFPNLLEAEAALDVLAYRVIRLVRTADYHRLGLSDEISTLESVRSEQANLRKSIRCWEDGFQGLHHQVETKEHLLILKIRWLVMKIWVATCLNRSEMIFDRYLATFRRIIELAHLIPGPASHMSNKFSFTRGLSPLLQFVVIKCRHLTSRLRALELLNRLSRDRESLWDKSLLFAIGKRIIEREHDFASPLDMTSALSSYTEVNNRWPNDEQRIRDNVLQDAVETHRGVDGRQIIRRKICFLMKSNTGEVAPVLDWITIAT